MNISIGLKRFWAAMNRSFRRTYTTNVCGHRTMLEGPMSDGESVNLMKMPLAKNGRPDYCLECLGKMSIKCAWCSHTIVIGDLITLYTPKKDYKIPNYAVRYTEDGADAFVGCSRMTCADGFDLCGRWMLPGKVERVPSPLELCLASCKAGKPSMVIVDVTSRYPESATILPTGGSAKEI